MAILTVAATSPGSKCSTPHLTSWLRDRVRVRVGVRGKVRVGSGLRAGPKPKPNPNPNPNSNPNPNPNPHQVLNANLQLAVEQGEISPRGSVHRQETLDPRPYSNLYPNP